VTGTRRLRNSSPAGSGQQSATDRIARPVHVALRACLGRAARASLRIPSPDGIEATGSPFTVERPFDPDTDGRNSRSGRSAWPVTFPVRRPRAMRGNTRTISGGRRMNNTEPRATGLRHVRRPPTRAGRPDTLRHPHGSPPASPRPSRRDCQDATARARSFVPSSTHDILRTAEMPSSRTLVRERASARHRSQDRRPDAGTGRRTSTACGQLAIRPVHDSPIEHRAPAPGDGERVGRNAPLAMSRPKPSCRHERVSPRGSRSHA
jgi:hypothetical protein